MKRPEALKGRRCDPLDHCRPANPINKPDAHTPARPISESGPKMARNRSRRRSLRNRAAASLQCRHVTPKYTRVNRHRRLTVRGSTTVSKASHRTVAIRKRLRRSVSAYTDCTTLRSAGGVKEIFGSPRPAGSGVFPHPGFHELAHQRSRQRFVRLEADRTCARVVVREL